MTLEARLLAISALCLVLFHALGFVVTHTTALVRFDAFANGLRGLGVPLAIVFTSSGRVVPLLAIALAGLGVAAIARYQLLAVVAILVAQVISQAVVEGFKLVFDRSRPDAWIVREELGRSYPSGHATTAIVFFGSWLVLVLMSPLPKPVKVALAAALAMWSIGIDWSRLALGAHYPTDVVGGTLLGFACTCALWAALLHFRIWSM